MRGISIGFNCYIETVPAAGTSRNCGHCTRWTLEFPNNCVDFDLASDKANTCINYAEEALVQKPS